ncbi:hypothetical protein [Streptomyces bottropensis]|uniref:Transposase n=1 Tax=Streptomyces bottropensis TaxID=42235 RepID=A0ABU8AX82_9ACTN
MSGASVSDAVAVVGRGTRADDSTTASVRTSAQWAGDLGVPGQSTSVVSSCGRRWLDAGVSHPYGRSGRRS